MEAEYLALIMGLSGCQKVGGTAVTVTSDSETMIRQLRGYCRVLEARSMPLFNRVRDLAKPIGAVKYLHVLHDHAEVAAVDRALNELLDSTAGKVTALAMMVRITVTTRLK